KTSANRHLAHSTTRRSSDLVFGVYYNGASSIWKSWGCDWSDGALSGSQHIYLLDTANGGTNADNCGTNTRQAFAHLVNRVDFARSTLFSSISGVLIADFNSPGNVLTSTQL